MPAEKLYVYYARAADKFMMPKPPTGWKHVGCMVPGVVASKHKGYTDVDMMHGPVGTREKARAAVEKHFAALKKKGDVTRFKVRFVLRSCDDSAKK